MKKILNQQDMRDINLNSVLRLIRRTGPLTRRQIEGELNLSWGAVSGATAALLRKVTWEPYGYAEAGWRTAQITLGSENEC